MKRILKSPLIYNYITKMNIKYTPRGPIRAIKTILKDKQKYNILYINVNLKILKFLKSKMLICLQL